MAHPSLAADPRSVGVLGLARSGRVAALLALRQGRRVFASDAGETPELRAAAAEIRRLGGDAELGGHTAARLAACDLLVVSPGIPPTASILRDPALADVPRVSELEFSYRSLRGGVVAVTGTNGKSTTTALTSQLLGAAGIDAPAAGNIGAPLGEVALREVQPDWVVVEASSFQLADVDTFSPDIGAVTNLSPDHLDRYEDVAAYYADKRNLFRNASAESRWILNAEDRDVIALAGDAPGDRRFVRVASTPGADERGGWLEQDGQLVLRGERGEKELVPQHELPLLGVHNVANALFAAVAADLVGAPLEAIRDGLRSARPLEHRLETVADRDGIRWINDSKATNVASAEVAIRSLPGPGVVLLGGVHKNEPYSSLAPALREHARVVLAYGAAADRIAADLGDAVEVERVAGDFEDILARAEELARPGDAILLAPACSSYDMFRDYAERGERFARFARAGEAA
ncbi:MAG TPA: UDP-N-acetylmuramoyl-L-alanine--D-glutamate ligase [Longimicrobiales bacterium]|nr:UDP-N-acetylmuramoyl-L-alanine--D-glutamate ligase [Longimicrobiales bacterium]